MGKMVFAQIAGLGIVIQGGLQKILLVNQVDNLADAFNGGGLPSMMLAFNFTAHAAQQFNQPAVATLR